MRGGEGRNVFFGSRPTLSCMLFAIDYGFGSSLNEFQPILESAARAIMRWAHIEIFA